MKYPTYRVVLTHDDTGEPDETFDVYVDLMLDEADALMRWTGMTWGKWLTAAVAEKEPDALRFFYWLARKRAGRPIEGNFSDITFWLHALTFDVVDLGDMADDEDADLTLTGPDPTPGVETESA